MKKILILVLVLSVMLTVVGCNANEDVSSSEDNTIKAEESNLNFEESKEIYDSESTDKIKIEEASGNYMTFEQLLNRASDIVKGNCIGINEYDSYKEYKFKIEKRFCGAASEDEIYLYVPNRNITVLDTDISYGLYDVSYEINKSYFLVMKRTVDVYLEHDRYMSVGGNIYLPAESTDTLKMYGETISKHSSIIIDNSISQDKQLTDYFLKYGENSDTKYSGMDYIKSTDDATIIKSSDYILKVKIDKEVYVGIADDRNTYDCTVVESYKGGVEQNCKVRIVFPKDAVAVGKEYILALFEFENASPRSFFYSSKNSLFDISEADMVKQYLSESIE